MQEFNEELDELEKQREKYINESDIDMVEIISHKIENKLSEILDSCDATITIPVTKVYKYENVIMADCVNGQTMIIQRDIVNSMRTNSFAYSKALKDGETERHKSFQKTVSIVLDECYNEVVERDNTIFVIAI
jgi:sugar-specific transcriptional regulator TrmB